MEEYKLSVASSPHASSPVGTKNLMRDVLIALIPAMAMGIYVFGPRALTTTLVSVIFCEIFEWGYCKLMHKPNPCGDLSAAITGVLLVFVCPVTLPYWTIIIGDFFAIVVVKQLFGGPGHQLPEPRAGWPCIPDAVLSCAHDHLGAARQRELGFRPLCHRRGYRCNPPGRGLHEGRHRSRGLCAGYVHREHRRLRG